LRIEKSKLNKISFDIFEEEELVDKEIKRASNFEVSMA
jgi:hypothetical protein